MSSNPKTLVLLAFVLAGADAFAQPAQTNAPTVAVPPRVTRTNVTGPGIAGPPPTNVTPALGAQPAPKPGIVRPAVPATNVATTPGIAAPPVVTPGTPFPRTNLAIPSATPGYQPPGGRPATVPGAAPGVRPAVPVPGGAPSGQAQGTSPAGQIGTPPAMLTAVDPVEPGSPAEEVFPPGLIKFQDAAIDQVLEVYQELTGRTVMRPNNLPQTKVTIKSQTPLTRREAIQALDTILSMNGVTMSPQGDKFVKATAATEATQGGRRFNELNLEDLPESGSLVSQIVRLTNALPREVAQALQPFAKLPNSILGIDTAGILVLRDYSENVKRMMEILEYIDVVPQQEFVDVVIPIKYALAGDIATVIGSLTAGGSATTVGQQQTRTGLASGTGGGFGSQGGFGGQPGMGGAFGTQQYGAGTQAGGTGTRGVGGAAASRSSFADRLRNIVNQAGRGGAGGTGDVVILGTTKIIADERTNSLLIFASKQDLITISNIIEKLDVVLPQVLIEAIIMEVSLGNELRYGMSYLQKEPTVAGDFLGIGGIKNIDFLSTALFQSGGTNGGAAAGNALPGGFSYVARLGDKFDITATASAQDSRVNVLSRPRIQTSHAVEANLFVGRTRPYVTGQYYGGFGAGPQTQFQQQQIGITLSVLPLINPDGLVVMDIRQRIQSLGREIQIDANFSVPETIDREANAKVSVRDRETIILGGFISNERTKSKSGVPILKDIPILGHLFSSNSRNDDRSELIVMIRPTVLPNPQDAAVTAIEEKAKLPGISRAEQEIEIFERQEQKKAAKEIKRLRDKHGEN